MAEEVIRRQGSATDHQSFTGAAGEITVENTNWNLRIHDGSTAGGHSTLMAPGTSTDPSLAFDTWRTPNANRPTLISISLQVETDGSNNGRIEVDVDESGGTTPDYGWEVMEGAGSGAGARNRSTISFIIPAGGAYQIQNIDDPNSNNQKIDHREFAL